VWQGGFQLPPIVMLRSSTMTIMKGVLVVLCLVTLLSLAQAIVSGDQVKVFKNTRPAMEKRLMDRTRLADTDIASLRASELSQATAAVNSAQLTQTVHVNAAQLKASELTSKSVAAKESLPLAPQVIVNSDQNDAEESEHLEIASNNESFSENESEVDDSATEQEENEQEPAQVQAIHVVDDSDVESELEVKDGDRDSESDDDRDADADRDADGDGDGDGDKDHDDDADRDRDREERPAHHSHHHMKDFDSDSETDLEEYMKYEVGGVNYMPKIIRRRLCLRACTSSLIQDRPKCTDYFKYYFTHKHMLKSCHKTWVHCAFHHCGGTTKFIEPA